MGIKKLNKQPKYFSNSAHVAFVCTLLERQLISGSKLIRNWPSLRRKTSRKMLAKIRQRGREEERGVSRRNEERN
jgi:hypothetical protein